MAREFQIIWIYKITLNSLFLSLSHFHVRFYSSPNLCAQFSHSRFYRCCFCSIRAICDSFRFHFPRLIVNRILIFGCCLHRVISVVWISVWRRWVKSWRRAFGIEAVRWAHGWIPCKFSASHRFSFVVFVSGEFRLIFVMELTMQNVRSLNWVIFGHWRQWCYSLRGYNLGICLSMKDF